MITWIRPSGSEITTNDNQATIDHAESMGWKTKDGNSPEALTPSEASSEPEATPEDVEDNTDTQEPAAQNEGYPDADIGDDATPEGEVSGDGDTE